MDRTQHKLAMEFFRSEIKTLSKRLANNKLALRHNQRITSKGLDDPLKEYDKSGEKYFWCAEAAIMNDKSRITTLHILYAEYRGKQHLSQEKREQYVSHIEVARKRMEEYIKEKQAAVVSNGATGTGGI